MNINRVIPFLKLNFGMIQRIKNQEKKLGATWDILIYTLGRRVLSDIFIPCSFTASKLTLTWFSLISSTNYCYFLFPFCRSGGCKTILTLFAIWILRTRNFFKSVYCRPLWYVSDLSNFSPGEVLRFSSKATISAILLFLLLIINILLSF